MFEKLLKRSSWTDIIISIIFLLFGILLIIRPEVTMGAITMTAGIVFIVMGVLKLIEYYTSSFKEDFLLTLSIIEVVIGVILLFASDTVLSAIKIILGLWIIINGIADLQTILMWKKSKSSYWIIVLIFSLLMIIAGIVILTSNSIVISTLGVIIVIYAILDIIDRIIFIGKLNKYMKED